jgi:hypothetical protein
MSMLSGMGSILPGTVKMGAIFFPTMAVGVWTSSLARNRSSSLTPLRPSASRTRAQKGQWSYTYSMGKVLPEATCGPCVGAAARFLAKDKNGSDLKLEDTLNGATLQSCATHRSTQRVFALWSCIV